MDRKELLNQLILFEKYYTGTKYRKDVILASSFYKKNQLNLCKRALAELPSREQLLEALVQKLKKKSVYKTLKRIQEGKAGNGIGALKGLSSLLTHCIIECEHGAIEYKILIPLLVEKIGEISYDVC